MRYVVSAWYVWRVVCGAWYVWRVVCGAWCGRGQRRRHTFTTVLVGFSTVYAKARGGEFKFLLQVDFTSHSRSSDGGLKVTGGFGGTRSLAAPRQHAAKH